MKVLTTSLERKFKSYVPNRIKKLIVVFLFCFCWSGVSQAEDISKLIEKRISKDRKSLDLKGLNIGPKGAKQLAKIESKPEA